MADEAIRFQLPFSKSEIGCNGAIKSRLMIGFGYKIMNTTNGYAVVRREYTREVSDKIKIILNCTLVT